MTTDNYKMCFIIAHKYYRNYTSYIEYYVDNIRKCYGEDALILVVDNNSTYFQDIREKLQDRKNVVLMVNETECKFELGAYNVGIRYLIDNSLLDVYDFYVFTQDTFILKQKYDFGRFIENNITACTINSWIHGKNDGFYGHGLSQQVLKSIHLENSIDQLSLCWCCSFVLHKSKLVPFLEITQDLKIVCRIESEACERFLSGILYHLNGNKIEDIDGGREDLTYDWNGVDLLREETQYHFLKLCQSKTEQTRDV
jgi:hypothetical protein